MFIRLQRHRRFRTHSQHQRRSLRSQPCRCRHLELQPGLPDGEQPDRAPASGTSPRAASTGATTRSSTSTTTRSTASRTTACGSRSTARSTSPVPPILSWAPRSARQDRPQASAAASSPASTASQRFWITPSTTASPPTSASCRVTAVARSSPERWQWASRVRPTSPPLPLCEIAQAETLFGQEAPPTQYATPINDILAANPGLKVRDY